MKILRVIASIDPTEGGMADGVINSSKELVKLGHQVEIVCFDDPSSPYLSHNSSVIHALGRGISAFHYSPKLQQWLDANIANFDCVIIEGIWTFHSPATRKACLAKNVPYFVFTHGMLDPWFKHTYPLKHLKKWLFWPLGDYRVLRDAQLTLFTTEEEQELAQQSFWLYEAKGAVVGYGTISPPTALKEQTTAFQNLKVNILDKPFLLFLGRIHPKKGCDLLIEAFSKLASNYPDWQLVIAGPDPIGLRHELETLCKTLSIEGRVHWTGMLTGNEKWEAFRAADGFILPSHQENFGIVVAESMACGTPVLISDKVNIWREVLSSGGGIVETDTIEGTEQMIRKFINLTKSEKNEMSTLAQDGYQKYFGMEKATLNLESALMRKLTAYENKGGDAVEQTHS